MTALRPAVSCLDGYDPDALPVDVARAAIRSVIVPVAAKHRRGRNKRGACGGIWANSRPLKPGEEKYFSLQDRPAPRPAVLVTLDGVAFEGERVSRVENSVPYKLEQITMKIVGP